MNQTWMLIMLLVASILFCFFLLVAYINVSNENANFGKAYNAQREFFMSICEKDFNEWRNDRLKEIKGNNFQLPQELQTK